MDLPPDEGPYPARGKDRGALDEAVFGQPLSGIGPGLPSVPDDLLPLQPEGDLSEPFSHEDQNTSNGFTLIHLSPGMPESPRLQPPPPSRLSPPIEVVEAVPLPDDFSVGKPIEIQSQVEQWLQQFAEPPAKAEPADSGETSFDMGPIQVEEPEHPTDTEEAADYPTDLAPVPETPPVDEAATREREFLEDDPAPCPGSLESAEASAQETKPDEEATLEGDASPSCADVVEPEPIAMIESVSEPDSEALFIPEMPDACLPEPEPESEPVAEREPPEEEIPASEPVPVAAIEPEAVILPEIPEEEIAEPEPVAVIEPEPELEPEPIAVIQPVPEPEPEPEREPIAVIQPVPEPEAVAELPPIPLTMHCAEEVRLEPGQTVKITREMVEVRGPVESSQRELLLLIAPALGSLLRLNEPLEAGNRFSQDDIDNDRIRYRHEGNDPGQDSFTLATPGGETEEATLHLTIRRRHRAPELVGPGQLVRVQEGCPVEDVLQDAVRRSSTEVDPGLAVLSIQGRGDWDYLLPKSKEWLPLSEVGPSRALLLGPAALIRFTPRAGWTGRIQLQFRAWDRSSGAEGECVDLSARWAFGGTTAFSAEAGNVTASVTSRFPRLNVVEPWVEELTAEDLIGEGMAVVRAEGMGVWQFSLDGGRSWQDIGPVYHGRARLIREHDRVRFLPRKGGSGKVTLIARPWDGTGPDAGDVTNLAGHHAFGQGTPFGESLQTRSWRLDGE